VVNLTVFSSVISNWLNSRKIPIEDVQQMAGHKWPSSTERYKREDMDEQRKLINQFHSLGSHDKNIVLSVIKKCQLVDILTVIIRKYLVGI
jgi:hypothetical protein